MVCVMTTAVSAPGARFHTLYPRAPRRDGLAGVGA
jgi:hypothetical protein